MASEEEDSWFLPDEVLLYIFQRLRVVQHKMTLLRVCQQWRRVALDQSLWEGPMPLRYVQILAEASAPTGGALRLHLYLNGRAKEPIIVNPTVVAAVAKVSIWMDGQKIVERLLGPTESGDNHSIQSIWNYNSDFKQIARMKALREVVSSQGSADEANKNWSIVLENCPVLERWLMAASYSSTAAAFSAEVLPPHPTLRCVRQVVSNEASDWVYPFAPTITCATLGLFSVARYPALEELHIRGTEAQLFNGDPPPNLRALTVVLDADSPAAGLTHVYPRLEELMVVDLRGTPSALTVEHLAEHAPRLRSVEVLTGASPQVSRGPVRAERGQTATLFATWLSCLRSSQSLRRMSFLLDPIEHPNTPYGSVQRVDYNPKNGRAGVTHVPRGATDAWRVTITSHLLMGQSAPTGVVYEHVRL